MCARACCRRKYSCKEVAMGRRLRIDLLAVSMILLCVGIVMIYSTSSIYAWERYNDSAFFLKRHLIFIGIGAVCAFLAMLVDYRKVRRYAKPILILTFIILVLVLIPGIGREVGGARRWFRFRFISFQPSELAGLVMVFYLADFIARKQSMMKSFMQGFVPPLCILGVCSGLILLEPDLGTTMSIGMVVFLMLYVSGVRFRYLVSTVLAALPALYLLVFTVPYRRMRIMAFLNPWLDPRGSGFQIIQSQIALGSGGLFGVGLGHSKQKLFYLPAAHTDFIFSIIGEELGLMGTFGIVLLFMLLIYHGVKIVRNSRDRFDFFLAFGIVLMITLKAVINIGVSCGVFPTKGLPLPFISYGGSSLVMDMVSIGLLLNIAKTQEYA